MKKFLLLFITSFILANCSGNKEENQTAPPAVVIKKPLAKDSLHIKCLGDMGFTEKIDTIILDKGVLTCRLGKYVNCAYSILDTFFLKNDTLDIELTSPDKQLLSCDCYFEIYARLNYNDKKPRSITINGNKIGSNNGIVIKEE